MIDISVIIINFNSSKYTIDCIKSIINFTSDKTKYEILVVDNHSNKSDFNLLEQTCKTIDFTNLKLYRNTVNSGFGSGNMYGFKYAKGQYLAFINNDVILKNDCLNILKKAYKFNKNIGICGPTTFTDDNKILPTLDFYSSPLKFFFGRKIFRILRPKLYFSRHKKLSEITFGDFVSGSFMFISHKAFTEVNGFDQNIFLYHEETDLCKRLNKIGLISALIPQAECFHHHGASTEKSILIKTELKKSLLYIIRKHYGFMWYKIIHINMILKYFFKSIFSLKYRFLLKHILNDIKLNQPTKVIDE